MCSPRVRWRRRQARLPLHGLLPRSVDPGGVRSPSAVGGEPPPGLENCLLLGGR